MELLCVFVSCDVKLWLYNFLNWKCDYYENVNRVSFSCMNGMKVFSGQEGGENNWKFVQLNFV